MFAGGLLYSAMHLSGVDTINACTLPVGLVALTIDGGAGNDTITGSQGADSLSGHDCCQGRHL
jgi:Ca2+-binding RTX toxin-like protein